MSAAAVAAAAVVVVAVFVAVAAAAAVVVSVVVVLAVTPDMLGKTAKMHSRKSVTSESQQLHSACLTSF